MKILFLGYDSKNTNLIDYLIINNCIVDHSEHKIITTDGYDLVICFGYRHIITKTVLNKSLVPILNLHISYLPWNRGAHPNFWSFYDSTPSGVTIHLVDEGLDTGNILYQHHIPFNTKSYSFAETYNLLKIEIEKLCIDNFKYIKNSSFISTPQSESGTFHKISDLPKEFLGWNSNIEIEIKRLHKLRGVI